MKTECVWCLAVSKDGRWIAAGTNNHEVFVWDANTYEKVLSHREAYSSTVTLGVDFSPDSTRLVSASRIASIWDITTRHRVQTLDHGDVLAAAKYSPQGDQIATATRDSVRVWDSYNGRSLVEINVAVTLSINTSLLWFNNHLFVISDSTIKQIEVCTESAVSEWPVPHSIAHSCIALPKHGTFIAYSTEHTVTFWGTETQTQLDSIQHSQDILSIALSPDDRLLAIGGHQGKITIQSLSRTTVSIMSRWIVAHMINSLALIIFHRIQSLCLVYTPHSRNQTFGSTTLHSIFGSTINWQMLKHY